MARFLALALALLTALAPSHARPLEPSAPRIPGPSNLRHPGPPDLRPPAPLLAVVAWNVAAGRGNIGQVASAVRSGAAIGTPPPQALIMLLQEAIDPPPVTLESFIAPVRQVGGRAMGTAILSTVPLLDPKVISLPQQRQPRAAAAATVYAAGQPLLLVSVHLENRGSGFWGGFLSEEARGRQADALLDAIPRDAEGILGGDLNTWLGPTEPAWRKLVERFPDLPPSRREVTFRDRLVLDHVLFALPDGWRAERRILPERYGSDHHPVVGLVWN